MATEKRLLDFEKARKKVMEILAGKVSTPIATKVALAMQEATVDAVEVVRCKNCASGKGSSSKICPLYKQGMMRDDDYCSYGERSAE